MENPTLDPQSESIKMTTTIKVMTILTFIGCVYSLITAISYINPQLTLEMQLEPLQQMLDKAEETSGNEMMVNIYLKSMDNVRILFENKYLFAIISLIGVGLCVYGAVEMRKMKKTGFYAYVSGQILPLLASLAITGWNIASGSTFIVSLLFFGIFILIYAFQLKHMR
jgi:hypothetical protein